ncbi:MAG: nucleotide exchange factor GrpE [Candidatus Paceibacterota bacterium]|jgi:molecular chaperone GrpE
MSNKKEISELDKLKKELEEVIKEKDQYLAGWQRARADHLNYIKDEQERLKLLIEYANQGLIMELLPILDSFEKAEMAIPQGYTDNQIIKGFLQIAEQIKGILKNQGLEELEIGQSFDPATQEIVSLEPNPELENDTIIEISLKGYAFKGKVIRPAKVKIVKN